jgi:hypothetical protein
VRASLHGGEPLRDEEWRCVSVAPRAGISKAESQLNSGVCGCNGG